jgi:hypothetical protein
MVVTVRDECGREISNVADTKILIERDHKLNGSGSNGHQDPTRFTVECCLSLDCNIFNFRLPTNSSNL